MFNFIVEADEMSEEMDYAGSKLSLADNTTANLHPNLPNYELLYSNEIYNRNRGKLKYIKQICYQVERQWPILGRFR